MCSKLLKYRTSARAGGSHFMKTAENILHKISAIVSYVNQ
jgi:hypothetical protein